MSNSKPSSVFDDVRKNANLAKEIVGYIKVIWKILISVAYVVAFPWWLFLRYHFGERFLSIRSGVMALFPLVAIYEYTKSPFAYAVLGLSVLAFVVHRIHASIYRRNGERWHSYSSGIPLVGLIIGTVPHTYIVAMIEPVLVALAGFCWSRIQLREVGGVDFFALYMGASALCMAILEYASIAQSRALLLDQIDKQIVAEHMNQALSDKPNPRQTDGFVVPGVSRWTEQERGVMRQSLKDLDPELKRMLDAPVVSQQAAEPSKRPEDENAA